jgi:hypothetical protein
MRTLCSLLNAVMYEKCENIVVIDYTVQIE